MVLLFYAVGVNLAVFLMMSDDKGRARSGRRRVPERRLWLLAWCGGALGLWTGMYLFRHKTRHRSFVLGAPSLVVVNGILYIFCFGFYLR